MCARKIMLEKRFTTFSCKFVEYVCLIATTRNQKEGYTKKEKNHS